MKLNVGLTKETGEADSPLCEASTNLEAELDPDLISQPDRLQEHANRLFRLAWEALGQEPNLQNAQDGRQTAPRERQQGGNHHRRRGRRASREQMVAIHGLATRRGIDLDGLLRDRYRVCQLYELSAAEGSELLSELKAVDTSGDDNVEAPAD